MLVLTEALPESVFIRQIYSAFKLQLVVATPVMIAANFINILMSAPPRLYKHEWFSLENITDICQE